MRRQRTRVKICGLTRTADIDEAVRLGVDAIGLVFFAASPRGIDIDQGIALVRALPPFVTSVGLFVHEEPASVRAVLERVPLDLLQFHGEESPDYCRAFGRPWIKAIRMRPKTDLNALFKRYEGARGLLLDTYDPKLAGGTGRRFDWNWIPSRRPGPIVLAGGLTPENVAECIRRVHPDGLDVSGGVESEKGRKDPEKIAAFMRGVDDGDRSR